MKKFTQEELEQIINLYTVENLSATKIAKLFKCATATIIKRLKELGIEVINKLNLLTFDIEKDIIPLYNQGISLTKIAELFNTTRHTLSRQLKKLGIEIINHQNKTKFNEHVFDSIDTEEKAYWLGFIFADGYIDYSPLNSTYNFELSLKADDCLHLEKFNKFMEHNKDNVKISNSKCNDKLFKRCRWSIANKHLWNTLNNYGCTPRKSLTLEFPNEFIFIESDKYSKEDLIRHFIRGYFDGDGCISYVKSNRSDKNSKYSVICSFLGTFEFLNQLKNVLDSYGISTENVISSSSNAYQLRISQNNSRLFIKTFYCESSIYLDRKYNRAMFFKDNCRLAEELAELLQTENGELCDENTVLNSEIKESESVLSVEIENY